MSKAHTVIVAVVLGAALGIAGCDARPQRSARDARKSAAAAALRETGAVENLGETRWASRAPEGASAPSFVVDASWPKPLPNDWRIGQVGGIAVDSHGNIWVYHRPRTLDASSAGAMPRVATNDRGIPISALGHPRPYAERSTGCCVPAPSVLKFDREGNLLAAWGGPSDPGFLEKNCREADGCFWPAREHGIFVDQNDFVYVSGNGEDGGARQQQGMATYPWAPSFGDDSHILKFTADGTFVYQIGNAGMDGPNSEKIDGGPKGTPQPYLVADMSVDPKSNRLYIADGYGNRRILIVDAATGTVRRPLRCVRAEPRRGRSEVRRGRYRRRPVDRGLSSRQHETHVLPEPDALRDREPRWISLRLRPRQQPRPNLRSGSGGIGQAVREPERGAGQVRLRA